MPQPTPTQVQAIPDAVWLRIEKVLASDASPRLKDTLVQRLLGPAVTAAKAARKPVATRAQVSAVSKEWLTPAEVQALTGRSRKAVTVAACIHKWRRQGQGKQVRYWHLDALQKHSGKRGPKPVAPSTDEPPLPFMVNHDPTPAPHGFKALAGKPAPFVANVLAPVPTKPLDVVGTAGPVGKADILVTLPPQGRRVETIYQPPIPVDADISRIAGPVKITTFVKE